MELGTMRWHALHVRSRCEKAVEERLSARSLDAFLPLYASRRKWADRYKTVPMPLFPGYVFCRLPPAQWSLAVATDGVIDFVRFGMRPEPINAAEIEAIQRAVSSSQAMEPYDGLLNGDEVTLTTGPLRGLTGKIQTVRGNLRMVLSMELLNRSVLVEIERDWIAPPSLLARYQSLVRTSV